MRRLPWLVAAACAAAALAPIAPPGPVRGFDLEAFGRLPVLHGGRIKPFDTVARTALLQLKGKQAVAAGGRDVRPVEWLLDAAARPEIADAVPVFRVDEPEVAALASKTASIRGRYFSLRDLTPALPEIERQAEQADAVPARARTRYQGAVVALRDQIQTYHRLQNTFRPAGATRFTAEIAGYLDAAAPGVKAVKAHQTGAAFDRAALARLSVYFKRYQALAEAAEFRPLPPLEGEASDQWRSPGEGLLEALRDGDAAPGVVPYATMLEAYAAGDAGIFNTEAGAWADAVRERAPRAAASARAEALFNRAAPFTTGMAFYLLAVLAGFASRLRWPDPLRRAALALLASAFAAHTAGLAARILLQGRPPVTNLYSSAVFVGWVAAGLGVLLERRARDGVAAAIAGAIGFATLIIAHHLALEGDSMEMMRAVLDSNFWLSTHVVTVTVGYAATFLAGTIGAVWLVRRAAGARPPGPDDADLPKMAYGVVCFAMFFSFVGTVLGGIWADQSWGRFWGWDPKENGALLIVLWNAVILHARWGKLAGERGLMAMAVFGNVITSLSWFGVNMLGIGLHSYGFMDKAFAWLTAFVASQFLLMALALLPARR